MKLTIEQELLAWQARIKVIHRKMGRSLVTAILHVEGTETPPIEALSAATADWKSVPAANVVKRPDELGKQVYWVNIVASDLRLE